MYDFSIAINYFLYYNIVALIGSCTVLVLCDSAL